MSERVEIERLYHDDPDVERVLETWWAAITLAHTHEAGGRLTLDFNPGTGYVWFVANQTPPRAMAAVVQTGGITAASGDVLGEGTIMLRKRDGADLEDWKEAHCYSHFTFDIPAGTRLGVVPDGDDWQIPGAQYCPPTGGP